MKEKFSGFFDFNFGEAWDIANKKGDIIDNEDDYITHELTKNLSKTDILGRACSQYSEDPSDDIVEQLNKTMWKKLGDDYLLNWYNILHIKQPEWWRCRWDLDIAPNLSPYFEISEIHGYKSYSEDYIPRYDDECYEHLDCEEYPVYRVFVTFEFDIDKIIKDAGITLKKSKTKDKADFEPEM